MGSLSQIGANKASSITDLFLPILVNAMSSVTLKNPVLVTWTTSHDCQVMQMQSLAFRWKVFKKM